jgi:hypothetical protein
VLNDAQQIYNILVDPNLCGYQPANVTLLRDQDATKAAIVQAFADLTARCDQNSTVFFYLSSHGGRVESGPQAGEYILPVDTVYSSGETIAQTAIRGDDFTAMLQGIPARKVLVVFDCCHSGGIGQPKDAAAPAIKAGLSQDYYEKLKAGKGRVILASSRDDEYSWVLPGAANSLFTEQLLGGLRGGIASEDGMIRIFDVFEYVQPKVTAAQSNQHPIFKAEVEENFPVSLYVGGKKGVVPKDDQGFRYDAYISYVDKEPDATWVWDTLVPKLEDAGLRVAVSGDSGDPGVARVVNIERGITQAKRMIIVLSEAYMMDNMAAFENQMAQTLGIQEGAARLLPLKIGPINDSQLPLRFNYLTILDLSNPNPRRLEREFSRLLPALQGPVPRAH